MKNYLKIFALIIIMTFLASAAIQAANPQIFIRNQPFKEKVFLQKGNPFVPLEALLKALNFGWNIDENNNLDVLPASGGKESSIKTAPYKLTFQGKAVSAELVVKDNIVFVNLRSFSTALGATYDYNKDNNIVDVLFSKLVAPVKLAIPKPAPSPTETGAAPSASPQAPTAGKLIQITPDQPTRDTSGYGGIRQTASVKNTSNHTIENIKITCRFLLADGTEVYKYEKVLKLAGGETQKVEFFWTNPSNLEVQIKLEADYPE